MTQETQQLEAVTKKKKFKAKPYAHISIQFTMDELLGVDMLLTFNKSPKEFRDGMDASYHGYSLASEETCLSVSDHKFLERFCVAYLNRRKVIYEK